MNGRAAPVPSRQAVVLSGSGCGSVDAYEVGVLKALAEGLPHCGGDTFDAAIYSGSAFGAFNAAVMASDIGGGTGATAAYLEQAWLDGLCSTGGRPNGVFRIRCDPRALLDPRAWLANPLAPIAETARDAGYLAADLAARVRASFAAGGPASFPERLLSVPAATPFFDMSPLRQQLRTHVALDRIRTSGKALMINATDWERGIGHIFANADMTDPQGYDILQASAAYLLVFPFVEIGGRPFGGGPGSQATPLRPVLETWAPRTGRLTVHVVYLDPPMPKIPTARMSGMLGGMGRYFNMVESLNIRADVEYGPGAAPPPGTDADRTNVTIHHYRPSRVIVDWFAVTDFDRRRTEAFMALGYRDAMQHDCRRAGCTA